MPFKRVVTVETDSDYKRTLTYADGSTEERPIPGGGVARKLSTLKKVTVKKVTAKKISSPENKKRSAATKKK